MGESKQIPQSSQEKVFTSQGHSGHRMGSKTWNNI